MLLPRAERDRLLYVGLEYTTHDRRFLRALTAGGWSVTFARLAARMPRTRPHDLVDGVLLEDLEAAAGSDERASLEGRARFLSVLTDRLRPALIHAGPVQDCAFPAALVAGRIPLSCVSWGSDLLRDARRSAPSRERARVALSRADRVVCDCRAVRDEARQIAEVPDTKVVMLPWGTDVSAFRPTGDAAAIRDELGWHDRTIVLHTRSFEPGYAVDVVVDAFTRAHRMNTDLRLVLAGDGSLRPDIERQVAQHGLEDEIRLVGRTDNESLPRWFRAADVYVSASESDGSSVSLLEALATGLPCVVTDIPSNAEWVVPGVNGWLARTGQVEEFARALLASASLSKPEREEMRRRNREVAVARADWSRNVQQLLDAYETLAESHG